MFVDNDTMKKQRYALGLCRILQSPIEYIEEKEETKENEIIYEDLRVKLYIMFLNMYSFRYLVLGDDIRSHYSSYDNKIQQ